MATKKKAAKRKSGKKKATKRKPAKRKTAKKKPTKKAPKRKAAKRKTGKKKAAKRKPSASKQITVTELRRRQQKAQREVESIAERIAKQQGVAGGGVSLNEELASRGLRKEKSTTIAGRFDICDGNRRVLRSAHAGDVWEWLAKPATNKRHPSAPTEAKRNAIRRGHGIKPKGGGSTTARGRAVRKALGL